MWRSCKALSKYWKCICSTHDEGWELERAQQRVTSIHRVPEAGNGWGRVIRLALRCSKASFWPSVSWSKDCCLMIRLLLEFHQGYVMSWAMGTVFYAWMLWCLSRKATCKSALCSTPWDHKTVQLIINFVSPLEAVPECPFQRAVLRALHQNLWLCGSQ